MLSFVTALMEYPFLRLSLCVTIAASISGGLVGTYVVVKRITFLAAAVGHTVLAGMGCALYLQRVHGVVWVDTWMGAFAAAALTSALLGWLQIYHRERSDAAIGILWAVGMATGVLFLHLTPGSQSEALGFLFGNVLWVAPRELWTLLGLNALLLGILTLLHPRLVALCFDEQQAEVRGMGTHMLYQLLLLLVALTTVMLTAVVGSSLVMALLTLPPSIAALSAKSLGRMLCLSVCTAVCVSITGLAISYPLDWPPGATIALLAGLTYAGALCLRSLRMHLEKRMAQRLEALSCHRTDR